MFNIVSSAAQGFSNSVQTILNGLGSVSNFVAGTFSYVLQSIPNTINYVASAFNGFGSILQGIISPLETFVSWIRNTVGQAFQYLANVISQVQSPIEAFKNALQSVSNFASGFTSQFSRLRDVLMGGIAPALDWVSQKIHSVQNLLGSLNLPKWLVPGSPTPFEIGLRGIADAMRDVVQQPLQGAFSVSATAPAGIAAGAIMPNSSATQVILNYAPTISTADEFEIRRKLQPIMNQAIRSKGSRRL